MSTAAKSEAAAPTKTFQADALSVRVYASQADLSQDVARITQAYLRETLAAKGSAAAILATGNSQIKFLEELVRLGGVDWSKITLFHMDEYLGIDAGHKASFRHYMRERVECRVKPRAFHYLEGDALLPMDECDRYTQLLRAQTIDLCCLGVGENGHLAFNDPPVANFEDKHAVTIAKLDEQCRLQQVNEGHFANMGAVPQYALTLTIPMLCAAKKMLCIAPEKRKAQAVKAALQGPISTSCPASILRRQPHATMFLDADSTSLL
ncbi:MAG TPA: glucosamine-6-phosphate deaminase [Verrucomicrobiae bacterium]|nr:glucosamine-6-phosphate deaminase [Verrucomicrobiae bacterium]